LRIVVEEDVAFLAFDQREYVDVVVHLPRLRSAAGGGGLQLLGAEGWCVVGASVWLRLCGLSVFHDESQLDSTTIYRQSGQLHTTRVSLAPPRAESISAMCM
jgi:hypothetical protein